MQNTRWNMQDKKVFISHSSKNAKFASWLSRLLKHLGVDPDAIFYSSDFRQGVRENISSDVFQALQNTVIDIVIMSNEYKSSEYCLSEAGIVLFKNKCSDKIVITLPGILGEKRAGFINENYIQLHLMEQEFFGKLINKLNEELISHNVIQRNVWVDDPLHEELRRELEKYKSSLPVVENVVIPYIDKSNRVGIDRECKDIELVKRYIDELHMHSDIFYKTYNRRITINPTDNPTDDSVVIEVKTETDCTIVNLSNEDYIDDHSVIFLSKNGGHDSFKESFCINNVGMESPERNGSRQMNGPYVYHQGPRICVPAHRSYEIKSTSTYKINIELFVQSKVLHIPCGHYAIMASFSDEFISKYKGKYIFRNYFIPPVPRDLSIGTVPRDRMYENTSKKFVSYQRDDGFPAGGGYVISLSKV